MICIKNLTITTKSKRPLVYNLNMVINKGDKIAIIGEEGNGKSTLLKAIKDVKEIEDYCSISGEISKDKIIIGYLEQSLNPDWNNIPVNEYFFRKTSISEIDFTKYERVIDISKALSEVGLKQEILDFDQKMGTLSGGEKVKLQIAKLLIDDPSILLLDEPTNDLDLETLKWLETFIKTRKILIIYISHDETLLENTANKILHLEYVKSKNKAVNTLKATTYTQYITERQQKLEKQAKDARREGREYKKDMRIISHQKSSVRSQQEKIIDSTMRRTMNKKMRAILREEDKAEKKLKTEMPETEEPIFISFSEKSTIPNGKTVLDFYLDKLEIGSRLLSQNINLKIVGPEKIGIVGNNGSGKTILIKKIYQEINNREDLKVGYMPQNYSDVLDDNLVAIDYVTNDLPASDRDKISAFIGRIKLNWREMNNSIKDLSYGQKAKLILLKMMVDECNVLILDEPTRNLSPLSNPVIRKILKDFPGSIISISHDRKFLKQVCSHIYNLDKNGLRNFNIW